MTHHPRVALQHIHIQPIPLGVTFSNAVSKLKAQSLNVSFHWNVAKETFELWAFENVTPSGIGCIYVFQKVLYRTYGWRVMSSKRCYTSSTCGTAARLIHLGDTSHLYVVIGIRHTWVSWFGHVLWLGNLCLSLSLETFSHYLSFSFFFSPRHTT